MAMNVTTNWPKGPFFHQLRLGRSQKQLVKQVKCAKFFKFVNISNQKGMNAKTKRPFFHQLMLGWIQKQLVKQVKSGWID